ncbi:MAG: VCBS repeat-containing protein [Polyangiaceae bacterium]
MKLKALVAASSICLVAACGSSRSASRVEPSSDLTVSAATAAATATPSAASASASANASSTETATPSSSPSTVAVFDPGEHFQPCPTNGPEVEKVDLNGDGRPDVFRVSERGHLFCQVADLTFDGLPDEVRFFDELFALARVQRDLDGDGQFDELVVKRGGGCLEYVDRDQDGRFDVIRRLEKCP